jgi:hypothetical protein
VCQRKTTAEQGKDRFFFLCCGSGSRSREAVVGLRDGIHYVDQRMRKNGSKVTWVLAALKGKELEGILKSLLYSSDYVAAV